jgi:hypothetical protein
MPPRVHDRHRYIASRISETRFIAAGGFQAESAYHSGQPITLLPPDPREVDAIAEILAEYEIEIRSHVAAEAHRQVGHMGNDKVELTLTGASGTYGKNGEERTKVGGGSVAMTELDPVEALKIQMVATANQRKTEDYLFALACTKAGTSPAAIMAAVATDTSTGSSTGA